MRSGHIKEMIFARAAAIGIAIDASALEVLDTDIPYSPEGGILNRARWGARYTGPDVAENARANALIETIRAEMPNLRPG